MDDYESLVNHVFLPPKVPQSEEKLALDTIAKTTASALTAFKGVLADDTQQALLDGVLRMTHASLRTHTNGSVNAEKLEEQLQALPRTGGTIILHIGAQNAGVLISRHCDDLDSQLAIRFEVFELAPINRALFQSAERLMRAFPGAAIDVDLNTFSESGLMNTIARTLAKMSFQPAPGMQPQINKAQAKMDEDRDSTHPGMISEFFMGFLCSLGNPVRVASISKNTREEVMWRKARSPWRRSPVWLLFRVALQLRLPHTLYKEFMAFMMSSIVTDSRFNALSCDLRYAVTAKVARRLYKLSASPNAAMVMHVQKTLAEATSALEQKWQHIQAQAETVLDLLPLAALDFERDSSVHLPGLDAQIRSIDTRQNEQSSTDFYPGSKLKAFLSGTSPALDSIAQDPDYVYHNMHAFESWVAAHLDAWTEMHKNDADACESLYALLRSYHELASEQYLGNPESLSVYYLTALEVWRATDVCATQLCPLIGDYKLDISLAGAQSLLLPRREHMSRLTSVEAYVTRRESYATFPSSELLHAITDNSFAARYFKQSPTLQALRTSIEAQAAREKNAKIAELFRLKGEYERLMSIYSGSQCDYVEEIVEYATNATESDITETKHYTSSCRRCVSGRQAETMKIEVQEWPLPTKKEAHSRVIVFELQPPSFFVHWRDSLVYLIIDILKATHIPKPGPVANCHLKADGQLSYLQPHRPSQRIGMLSEVKPSTVTHRRELLVSTATDDMVCLDHGSNYRYYDGDAALFVGGFELTDTVSLACTYQLPGRSMALQRPAPPGTDVLRVSHGFCGDDISAAKLLAELDVALQRIKKNWESSQALSVFISIASRLLSLSASTNLRSGCMEYLRSARAIAFGWMHDLREKAQNVGSYDERKTYLSKRAEVAVICLDSFNVDDAPLADILDSAEQASMLVQCMIIMQESRLLLAESSELTTKLLSMRSQRLLYRCHGALAAYRLALDDGISESWTGFRPGSPWTIAASSHWLTTTTVTGHSGATLRVHFNLITGELLVNGLPLDRLPGRYEDCASYRTLFGSTTVEVMPTTVPGMDFAAKREFQGYEVQFVMVNTNGLLVQASKAGQCYELIPKDLFCDTYPAAFTEEHVHWYRLGDGAVEFRPLNEAWNELCDRKWILAPVPETGKWRLTRESQTLLDLTSSTAKTVSHLLLPLANAASIHVLSQPSAKHDLQALPRSVTQLADPGSLQEVEVEMPDLQLSFVLKAGDSNIRSKEFPTMYVDPDQSLGTLIGLENMLLLRDERGTRMLLILGGMISHSCNGDHTRVSIQKKDLGSIGNFHTFQIDMMLGRLVGNGDIQSKLFLAYLHALTAYPLPDALTRKTGTEQALSMLRSADVRSFDRLTTENADLLGDIAALTLVRDYYPANERVMQTVKWSSKLGFLA
ncbi:hypothetical protein LTR27_008955 [Elasticomyces elasticus]|nr:hypothetical protein LTR27_008955 [Elasticomyces elasticus]